MHTNIHVRIFLKGGNKAETPAKKYPYFSIPGYLNLEGQSQRVAPEQTLLSSTASSTSACGSSSEQCCLKRSLWFFHSRWIHSESKPSTWPAAPFAAFFFVCLMILDQPFSLGSACIASPPPFYKCCHHPLSTWHWIEEPPRTRLWGAGAYWDVQATLNEKKNKGKNCQETWPKKTDQQKLGQVHNLWDNLPLRLKKTHNPKVIKRRISVICRGGSGGADGTWEGGGNDI